MNRSCTRRTTACVTVLGFATLLGACSSTTTSSGSTTTSSGSTTNSSRSTTTSSSSTTTSSGSTTTTNGVASGSPTQIVNSALQAMQSAESVRESQSTTRTEGGFDVLAFSNGDLDGTASEGGYSAMLVKIGGTEYLNAPAGFWTFATSVSQAMANLFANKWVSAPYTQLEVGSGFTISSLASTFEAIEASVSAGTTGTVNGQAVVSIRTSNGGILWVATTGTAYPIAIQDTTGMETFSDWNQGTVPTPPAGAEPASSF